MVKSAKFISCGLHSFTFGYLTHFVWDKIFILVSAYSTQSMIKMPRPEKRKEKLIRKHKPMTKKEVEKRFKEMKALKDEMTTDATILEQNLKKFNKITDPLTDPESGDVLCWIRRPTSAELESMIPSELLEYRNKQDQVPAEIMDKHKDFQFEMMARLIDVPTKDAKWWKKNANQVFQMLFQMHLKGVMEDLGISAENF